MSDFREIDKRKLPPKKATFVRAHKTVREFQRALDRFFAEAIDKPVKTG